MAEEQTPSVETGATPVSTSTATVTPAQTGATPESKPALTIEELLKRNEELENKFKNADEERTRHRKKLSTYEQKEEAEKLAALSEVEKASKRAQDAEARIQHYQKQLVSSMVKLAAQAMGIIDPDIAALAIQNDLELGDDGLPTNVDKALEKLIKNKPYLVAPKQAEPAPTPTAQTATPPTMQTPNIPAMNPGRSAIASPAQQSNPQGTFVRPSWNDAFPRP